MQLFCTLSLVDCVQLDQAMNKKKENEELLAKEADNLLKEKERVVALRQRVSEKRDKTETGSQRLEDCKQQLACLHHKHMEVFGSLLLDVPLL